MAEPARRLEKSFRKILMTHPVTQNDPAASGVQQGRRLFPKAGDATEKAPDLLLLLSKRYVYEVKISPFL